MPSINTELGERALSKMQHEMDWKPLKERCLRQYPAWSTRHVDRILREYMRFLALKVATRDVYDTIVLAPVLLDAMWQQHILCTQQYYNDCQLMLQANQILHYNSDATINLTENVRAKRMELTKASLCMMFSGMYPLSSDAKGIWDFDEVDSSAASAHLGEAMASSPGVQPLSTCDTEEDDDTPTIDRPYHDDEAETENESAPPPNKLKSPKKEKKRKSKGKTKQDITADQDRSSRRMLYVYLNGKVSRLHVYPHETILEIKEKIHRRDGILPHKQYLEWEGLALEEAKSIGHYGIPNDATLVLTKLRTIGTQHIQMMHEGLLDSVDEEDGENDEDQEERDDPDTRNPHRSRARSQSPRKNARKPPLHPHYVEETDHDDSFAPPTEDDRHHQAMLNKMRIQSHNNGGDETFTESLNKMRIKSHNNGSDETFTENLSTIPSRPKPKPSPPLQVFINTIMGFTISLSAKASDNVAHIKQLIEEQEDIPLDKQILVLEGMPLEDHQLLADYTKDSKTLHVLLRLRGGSSTASISTAPSSTMAAVPRKKTNMLVMGTPRTPNARSAAMPKWR